MRGWAKVGNLAVTRRSMMDAGGWHPTPKLTLDECSPAFSNGVCSGHFGRQGDVVHAPPDGRLAVVEVDGSLVEPREADCWAWISFATGAALAPLGFSPTAIHQFVKAKFVFRMGNVALNRHNDHEPRVKSDY